MISEAPPFWWSDKAWQGLALSPFGWAYGRVARWRMERAPRAARGGAGHLRGKPHGRRRRQDPDHPGAGSAGHRARAEAGLPVAWPWRQHGGTDLVDPARHAASEVGDEPLLLAACATTVVSRDRLAGARRLVAEGVDLVIMDDGFQSARLRFDYALLVVDSRRGLGNGRLIPAGPVRAPVVDQLRHASALLRIGEGDAADRVVRLAARAAKPIRSARLAPRDAGGLAGRRVLAFAAIGDPGKFFATVEAVGADPGLTRAFPDHHVYSEEDAADLLETAQEKGLALVTTAKDMARLKDAHGRVAELSRAATVIAVDLVFSDQSAPDQIIDAAMAAFRKRRRA